MAFIPVPDTVELVFVFTTTGREQRVVLNVTSAVAWTITSMQSFGTAVVNYVLTAGLAWMSDATELTKLHLTDVSSPTGPSFDWTAGSASNLPLSGTITTEALPLQVALVTTLRTLSRGRSFRGRNYWPGISINALLPGGQLLSLPIRVTPQQAFVVGLEAAIAAITGLHLVVVSKKSGGVFRTSGVTTPVSSIDTNNRVDTQRKRVEP